MSSKGVLSNRQQAFVTALLSGDTMEAAARGLGISVRQASRYHGNPLVRAALREAQDEALAAASRQLTAGTGSALAVLKELMENPLVLAAVRIRAAQVWLDVAFKAREVLDLTRRIGQLEERMVDR